MKVWGTGTEALLGIGSRTELGGQCRDQEVNTPVGMLTSESGSQCTIGRRKAVGRWPAIRALHRPRSLSCLRLALPLIGCASLLVAACGAAAGTSVAQPAASNGSDGRMPHELCDLKADAARGLDANGDGRPDVLTAPWRDGGTCRAVDLNFDGKIDVWVFMASSGSEVRREFDFDLDGQNDEVQEYKAGQMVRRYRSAGRPGHVDTWDWLDAGRLIRTERDADGNGVVDQWWDFAAPDCPVITSDRDGDGKPDPGSETRACKGDAFTNLERREAPKGPSFERPGGAPQELENRAAKPVDKAAGGASSGPGTGVAK
jgi:hypothetical protein